ncbi:MAG: preprotein translocase subunit SecA [Ruminococcus sp.]|nr:preprotein translocase subunit SecA [Ruminococcus sp.]
MGILDGLFGNYSKRELKKIEPIKQSVLDLDGEYSRLTEAQLKGKTPEFKKRLAEGETLDDILPEALATVREAAWRVLGKKPFPVQIIGAIVLHQGRIAEMRTGEGKTLVACCASYLNALEGKGVHVVTVNDYLAKSQSEEMGKVHRYLGLTIGCIIHDLNNDQRREAYSCDITYGTNNEFGFDYLRDNMVIYKSEKVQREFNFAIVDEVDSILIDEARTPLIISGRGDKSTEMYTLADRFSKTLKPFVVAEMDTKTEQEDVAEDCDYIIDEKAKTATITRQGVKKAEKYFNVENLYDADNSTLLHHVNQALKANGVMKRDIDYVVNDGEIVIVDEFTGRLMMGRRYNDGLHQAIEAKEGVKVMHESKTLASITFQNFFRLYHKLSGMTGTAMTEEDEFREIYKLDVIEIPTNRPVQRIDHSDVVYKTEAAKFRAAIDQIEECHKKGQPVLVGTISIEKSEVLSKMLQKKGIKHNVLNAKQHAKEAEIVAQAGKLGAVTIATNMAGRGTDILLGGNAEFMAKADMKKNGMDDELISEAISYADTDNEEILAAREEYKKLFEKHSESIKGQADEVRRAGGLFILGTERHESRRIDNQLRGRAGRQGDEGESRFFLSLEDDLMRLFGGERLQAMMTSMNVEEDMPIESKMLSKVIESSQKKVEGRNFAIRKNVLNYDDVMSTQRAIIYEQRAKVLNGEDIHEYIRKMISDWVTDGVNLYIVDGTVHDDWNLSGLREHFNGLITSKEDFRYTPEELGEVTKEEIVSLLEQRASDFYDGREKEMGSEMLRELERVILLKVVDLKWMSHIDDMEELRRGIGLRAFGQKNPVVEYRYEGFEMFDAMIESIREDTVRLLFTIQIKNNQEPQRERVAEPMETQGDGSYASEPRRVKKVGRNDPCPCGSGKKYKNCCGRDLK